jgi:hypothetical protein
MSDDFEKLEKLIQKEEQLGDQCTAFIFEECECASEPTERRNKAYDKLYDRWKKAQEAICGFESSDPSVMRYVRSYRKMVEYSRRPIVIRKPATA